MNMPIPETLPLLAVVVKHWLGREPETVQSLYGQVRWTWTLNKEAFERDFNPRWIAHEAAIKTVPDWMRQAHVISVLWPSDDKFIINVILRDASVDFWCLPPDIRETLPEWNRLFCKGCRMAHDVCKCQK